jgi:hypothetical protein
MKKPSSREKDAKCFESAINAENKGMIEQILGVIDPCSHYRVYQSRRALKGIIGDRAEIFLKNLLSTNDIDEFTKKLDLAPETKKYINFLSAAYSPKLHGIIDATILHTPDSLCSSSLISTRYDLDEKESLVKITIVKDNKEQIIIEDTPDSLLFLSSNIINYVLDKSSELTKFNKDLGIHTSTITGLKRSLKKLDEMVSARTSSK